MPAPSRYPRRSRRLFHLLLEMKHLRAVCLAQRPRTLRTGTHHQRGLQHRHIPHVAAFRAAPAAGCCGACRRRRPYRDRDKRRKCKRLNDSPGRGGRRARILCSHGQIETTARAQYHPHNVSLVKPRARHRLLSLPLLRKCGKWTAGPP
jgi:hypothetical protein